MTPLLPAFVFQYPLRVKWILQLVSTVSVSVRSVGFSTLYGSSGFFNTPAPSHRP